LEALVRLRFRPAKNLSQLIFFVGRVGFIGRFLVRYIHENNLAAEIRIVDKQLPQLAWLAPEFEEACSGERFMQGDMSRDCICLLLFLLLISADVERKKIPLKKRLRERTERALIMFSTAAEIAGSVRTTRFTSSIRCSFQ
jgi:nucleoside-diphosphate-sugar epimerase